MTAIYSAAAVQPDAWPVFARKGSATQPEIVEKSGRCLMAANYGGGSVAAFPVKEDGRLGEVSSFVRHTGKSIGRRQQ